MTKRKISEVQKANDKLGEIFVNWEKNVSQRKAQNTVEKWARGMSGQLTIKR